MPSLLLASADFDVPARIAADLSLPEGSFTPDIGFLFCDSQIAVDETLALVQRNTPCPVVGGTSLALPFTGKNSGDCSASLLLLQKDGLATASATSGPLDPARCREQVETLYASCRRELGGEPALIMVFLPLMPGLPMDAFVKDIFDLAGSVPVVGGTVTNDLLSTKAAVFSGGKALQDRIVMVMLGGAVEPVFAVGASVTTMSAHAATVTRAEGARVFAVDDAPFCDYLRGMGIPPEDRINGVDALMQYGPTPADVVRPGRPDDGVPEIRCISYTNLDEGSAVFSGPMPEGSRLRMSVIAGNDVGRSAADCLNVLKNRMEQKEKAGYRFDALLCISCVARYFAVIGEANPEEALMKEERPSSLGLAGMYGFSEIGPTLALDNGRVLNRSHSASIVMCAL